MATTTSNLSLRKPESSDTVNVALDIASNMQTLDDKWASSAAADIGAAAAAGSALTVARTDHVHKVGSGTADAPGLPVGESNSGLYRIGAGQIGMSILGALVATFKSIGIICEAAFTGKYISTPAAAPAAGYLDLYAKSDGNWYKRKPDGTEALMLNAGAAQIQAGDIAAGTATMLKIAEASGTGSSGVITFSSIPGTYRALEILLVGRSTTIATNTAVQLAFNGDSTLAHYADQFVQGASTAVQGAENIVANGYIAAGAVSAASSTSNAPAALKIILPEYANTGIYKPVSIHNFGALNASTGFIIDRVISGIYFDTGAITTITLTLAAGNWTTTTRATLYGVPS